MGSSVFIKTENTPYSSGDPEEKCSIYSCLGRRGPIQSLTKVSFQFIKDNNIQFTGDRLALIDEQQVECNFSHALFVCVW